MRLLGSIKDECACEVALIKVRVNQSLGLRGSCASVNQVVLEHHPWPLAGHSDLKGSHSTTTQYAASVWRRIKIKKLLLAGAMAIPGDRCHRLLFDSLFLQTNVFLGL